MRLVSPSLVAGIEPTLGWVANIEVANEKPTPSGYVGHSAAAARSRRRSSFCRVLSGW